MKMIHYIALLFGCLLVGLPSAKIESYFLPAASSLGAMTHHDLLLASDDQGLSGSGRSSSLRSEKAVDVR